MAIQEQVYPVYLIGGFLDSGKTTFINGVLSDGFAAEDKTLLICCEEGEVEYENLRNVTVIRVEDVNDLTPGFLLNEQEKCGATQILIEYKGMWTIQDLDLFLPQSWVLYQIVVTAEGPTFESYSKNITSLMMDKLRNADMIIINRCTEQLRDSLRQKNLRLVNRRGQIYLENVDGSSEDYMDGTVSAFDLEQDVIDISHEDYGLWFVEIMDNPEMYEGKTVVYRAIMCKPPEYGHYFTPGRFAMVCCEDDMSFLAVACVGYDVKDIPERAWVEITARCEVEHWDPYGEDDGPVLHVLDIKPCSKPEEELVQM